MVKISQIERKRTQFIKLHEAQVPGVTNVRTQVRLGQWQRVVSVPHHAPQPPVLSLLFVARPFAIVSTLASICMSEMTPRS